MSSVQNIQVNTNDQKTSTIKMYDISGDLYDLYIDVTNIACDLKFDFHIDDDILKILNIIIVSIEQIINQYDDNIPFCTIVNNSAPLFFKNIKENGIELDECERIFLNIKQSVLYYEISNIFS